MENRESIDLDLDLGKYLLAWKRRWVPAVGIFLITTASCATFSSILLKPTYEAGGKLLFQKVDKASSLTGFGQGTAQLESLQANQTPLSSEIEVIASNPLLEKTIERLKLKNSQGQLLKPKDLKTNLTVKIIGATDVLKLTYKSSNSQEAAAIVNTLMNVYIENNILKNRSEAIAARRFIAKELPELEREVLRAEAEVRKFKEKNQVVDLSKEAESAVLEIASLNRQITAFEAELNGVNGRITQLRKQLGLNVDQAMAVNILSQSPELQAAMAELKVVEGELTNEKKRFLDTHPDVIALKNKKALLDKIVKEKLQEIGGSKLQISYGLLQNKDVKQSLVEQYVALEVQKLNLTRQLDSLYKSRDTYEKRAGILPQLQQTQERLERKVTAAKATYNTLLTKLPEIQVTENKNTGNAEIIEPARVPEKGDTGRIKFLALGVMLGLFLATTAVLLLEIRDKSLKTIEDIKQFFGYPLLGIIPFFGEKSKTRHMDLDLTTTQVPVRDEPGSFVSEIYGMIQANLKFLSSDKELKVIVVTSSVPGEGKSTVAANLAAAMAQLGRRVLLIDADLRNPSQHHLWELSNVEGLSNVLVGQSEFSPVTSPDIEYLEILTAGVIPPNPLALLDSQRMASLIKSASSKYNFVIIDAPSLILTADALTLGQMSDGILLVGQPGIVDRNSAAMAKEMLERSEQNILGLVINGINKSDFLNSLYYAKWYSIDGEFSNSTSIKSPANLMKNSFRVGNKK
ncbi:MAG: polysaccharide biosynthesis tyrosine autokinase [Nostocaceae cyanobacterium]|nr:polysaccharide biosynthesis tyrosine autokinase [Nostocaceae cyanobacterium]